MLNHYNSSYYTIKPFAFSSVKQTKDASITVNLENKKRIQ